MRCRGGLRRLSTIACSSVAQNPGGWQFALVPAAASRKSSKRRRGKRSDCPRIGRTWTAAWTSGTPATYRTGPPVATKIDGSGQQRGAVRAPAALDPENPVKGAGVTGGREADLPTHRLDAYPCDGETAARLVMADIGTQPRPSRTGSWASREGLGRDHCRCHPPEPCTSGRPGRTRRAWTRSP